MGKRHDSAVENRYLNAANTMPDGCWDDAYREVPYFENSVDPTTEPLGEKGLEVGEFDVLLVNYDEKLAYYEEIKTSRNDLGHAQSQLERAEKFFEDTEWDVIGQTVLEP